jgi:predicted transglutaminase-like cysteine proteinase
MISHPTWGDVRYEAALVPDNPDEQVASVIGLMRSYVLEDYRTPAVATQAQQAARLDPDPVKAVFSHVKRQLSFVRDEVQAIAMQPYHSYPIVEVLVRPVDMAGMCGDGSCRRMGDCDDYAMYAAALLMNLGVPVSFVTLAADSSDPTRYSHVYLAAYPHPGGERVRVAVDVSHGDYVGWEAPNYYGKRTEWAVQSSWLPWLPLGGLLYAAARWLTGGFI